MNKTEKFKWRGYLWYYAPLILWVIVIFVASSNTGSMSNTSHIFRPLLEFLFPTTSEAEIVAIHAYIRKAAHLTFYAILGFLAARALDQSRNIFLQKSLVLAAFGLVVIIAAGDEFNQSFLASRTASGYDVLLDAAGGAMAIFLFAATRRKHHYKN